MFLEILAIVDLLVIIFMFYIHFEELNEILHKKKHIKK